MTYWSRTSLISWGDGTCVIASETSLSSSSARISLHSAMHSLQMYTDGPEMNFRTESFDFPQKEQRRCLSCDIGFQRRLERQMVAIEQLTAVYEMVKHETRGRPLLLGKGLFHLSTVRNDVVDDAVRLSLICGHETVP